MLYAIRSLLQYVINPKKEIYKAMVIIIYLQNNMQILYIINFQSATNLRLYFLQSTIVPLQIEDDFEVGSVYDGKL